MGSITNMTSLTSDTENSDDTSSSTTATVLSNLFLFFLIFGLSATVSVRKLKSQLRNKFALATGVCMQFFIMPLLGFVSVMSLKGSGLTHAMAVTLLVVTSSPGGSYSNWWCSLFNADLALSVAMTAVSTVLSLGMLPTNLLLYSSLAFGSNEDEDVVGALDFGSLFISLGIVIGAILLGLLCSYHFENRVFQIWANRSASLSGLALILVSVFLSSGTGGTDTTFWNHPWAFYVGVAIPCLLGIIIANVLSNLVRLSNPETVAIAIECCYQNTGIATSIAVTMFSDPAERAAAVSVPLFYGVLEALVIGIYCVWAWKVGWTKAPKDEKFCLVISTTYEVDGEESDGLHSEHSAAEGLPRIAEESDHEEPSALRLGAEASSSSSSWSCFPRRQRRQNAALDLDSNINTPGSVRKQLPWWRFSWRSGSARSSSHYAVPTTGSSKKGNHSAWTPARNRVSSEDGTVLTTQSRNRATSEESLTPGVALESPRNTRRQLFQVEDQPESEAQEQSPPAQLLPQLLTTPEEEAADEEEQLQEMSGTEETQASAPSRARSQGTGETARDVMPEAPQKDEENLL